MPGQNVPVRMDIVPAGASNGDRVFLSATNAGWGTLTPPSAAGQEVVVVGTLTGGNGVTIVPTVLFQPQYIGAIT
jgi:hypothetical protein